MSPQVCPQGAGEPETRFEKGETGLELQERRGLERYRLTGPLAGVDVTAGKANHKS